MKQIEAETAIVAKDGSTVDAAKETRDEVTPRGQEQIVISLP